MQCVRILVCVFAFVWVLIDAAAAQQSPPLGFVNKLGVEIDVRSAGRILADELAAGRVILPDAASPVAGGSAVPQIKLRGGNRQVNNPANDYNQNLSRVPPIRSSHPERGVHSRMGRNIVVTFNDSSGLHVSPNPAGPGLIVDRVQLSGLATSNDGGQTWTTGYFPGSAGTTDTFGDPSIALDRHGVFSFANLTADSTGHGTIQVNKSTDGGKTWSPGVIVQVDDGSDKAWIAVGPDPIVKNRDNVYVTWTSFQSDGSCQLRGGRSTDGGVTFKTASLYAPPADPDPTHPQIA